MVYKYNSAFANSLIFNSGYFHHGVHILSLLYYRLFSFVGDEARFAFDVRSNLHNTHISSNVISSSLYIVYIYFSQNILIQWWRKYVYKHGNMRQTCISTFPPLLNNSMQHLHNKDVNETRNYGYLIFIVPTTGN